MRLADRIVDLTTRPVPLRTLLFRKLFERYPIGSYTTRLNSGAIDRPHYGLCMLNAALEAKALGHKAMTVVAETGSFASAATVMKFRKS